MNERPIDLSTRLDPGSFRKLYPEFEHTSVEQIDRALVDASAALHPSVFGGRYAEALGLHAADEDRLLRALRRLGERGYWARVAHRLADLHDDRPAETAVLVRRWARDDDFWIRRIAILRP